MGTVAAGSASSLETASAIQAPVIASSCQSRLRAGSGSGPRRNEHSASALRVVSHVTLDLAVLVEEDRLRRSVAARADVVEHEAPDAHEQLERLEVERWILVEARGEVRPQLLLPDDPAVVLS